MGVVAVVMRRKLDTGSWELMRCGFERWKHSAGASTLSIPLWMLGHFLATNGHCDQARMSGDF